MTSLLAAVLASVLVASDAIVDATRGDHVYRTVRFIAALTIATLVPFFIDRRARRRGRLER